jgi:hypothetical protein
MIRLLFVFISVFLVSCGSPAVETQTDKPVTVNGLAAIQTNWDYSQWPWLKDVKRDMPMNKEEGTAFYLEFVKFVKDEAAFRAAIKDGYDSVPWAQSAPCATTTSAVLEHSMKKAGFTEIAAIFGKHDKFGPTHNVEIVLYRLGWNYWPKANWKSQIAIGLLGGRYVFHGTPKHSGHIYTVFSEIDEKYDYIGDNGGYNHKYKAPGWEAGTEGFWLPPGEEPNPR